MSLERIVPLLGPPAFAGSADGVGAGGTGGAVGTADAGWAERTARTGIRYPADLRTFLDAYGPGKVNLVDFRHPSVGRSTLYETSARTIQLLGSLHERGDVPVPLGWADGQLLPFAHEISGVELAFLVGSGVGAGAESGNDWSVCAFGGGEFSDFKCGFEEFLHRYLVGDEEIEDWLGGCGEEPAEFTPYR